MKFLCGNCKAKYQIADEKVTGRTLRMKCRRCDHDILIDGHSMPAPPPGQAATGQTGNARRGGVSVVPGPGRSGGSGAHPMPPRVPGGIPAPPQRALARSKPPSALNADFRRHVAAPPEVPQRTSPYDQWHVAIQDVPVGPMTRDELGRKIETGAVTSDSLCWREGMDDWRPLGELPELAALLRRARESRSQRPSRSRAPAIGAPGRFDPGEGDDFDDDASEPTRIADLSGPNSPLASLAAAAAVRGAAGSASSPKIPVAAPAAVAPVPVQPVEVEPRASKGSSGLTTGIAVGLLVGILLVGGPMLYRNTWGSPAPVAPVAVAPPSGQEVERAAQDIIANVPDQPGEAVEEAPAKIDSKTATPAATGAAKTTKTDTTTKTAQPKDGLSDEERRLLERMGGGTGTIAKVGTGTKGTESSASSGPTLTASQLSGVVQNNKTALQRCYETALRASGGRQDGTIKVTVNVTVGQSGTVKSVTTQGTGLGDMNECLKKSVKAWRFPASGGDSEFAFPLVFQPGG